MPAGRERTFDKEMALEAAMTVFWQNGYAGTSMAMLTKEMGINKPSLYATFGGKEDLFVAALDRYVENYGSKNAAVLFDRDTPIRERLHQFLKQTAKLQCNPDFPGGCLMTLSTDESKADAFPPKALKKLCDINAFIQDSYKNLFAEEIEAGSLRSSHDPKALALYMVALTQGMSVSAKNGASAEELESVIDQAMAVFS